MLPVHVAALLAENSAHLCGPSRSDIVVERSRCGTKIFRAGDHKFLDFPHAETGYGVTAVRVPRRYHRLGQSMATGMNNYTNECCASSQISELTLGEGKCLIQIEDFGMQPAWKMFHRVQCPRIIDPGNNLISGDNLSLP